MVFRTKRKPDSVDIRTRAQNYAEDALEALADIMRNGTSEAARIAAAREMLDRGYGKCGQGRDDGQGEALSQPTIHYILPGEPVELSEGDYDTRPDAL